MATSDGDAALFASLDDRLGRVLARPEYAASPLTLLYSGGVDSSILAHALRDRSGFLAISVGTPTGRDVAQARSGARALALPHRAVCVGPAEVERLLAEEGADLWERPEPERSVAVAMLLAATAAPPGAVVTGQGADELFGGYRHFEGLTGAAAEERRREDLAVLLGSDWPGSADRAVRRGRRLLAPFLEEPFHSFAGSLPLSPIAVGGTTKPLLRRWAVHRGVPRSLADRPKIAFQYGSGIAKLLARSARPSVGPP